MSKIMSQVASASVQPNNCRSTNTKTPINGKSNIGKIATSSSASSGNKPTGNQKLPVSPEPTSLDLTRGKSATKLPGSPEPSSLDSAKGKSAAKMTRIPISGSMAHLADGGDAELEVTKDHIGKLVCISGTQIGILRYIGFTKFQQGVWCGIELDSAVGKNDGSVNNHRYFQCKEMYGIFAPVAKVCPVMGNETLSVQKYASSTLCLMQKQTEQESKRDKLVLELQSLEISAGPASPIALTIPAPATTPVQTNANECELFRNGKRLKKERGKYATKQNEEQLQKKRKLDSDQKCPASLLESIAPHLARFKEEIKSSGSVSSPLHSPPKNYNDAFSEKVASSTPSRKLRQRLLESLHGSAEEEEEGEVEGFEVDPSLTLVTETVETTSVPKEVAPLKRPNSIAIPGSAVSSEDSSELGIFGVVTPELIGGDWASLAMSFPPSCCSSPDENVSSLGLLTPSQLQDCWNSNTNEEELYQHLRSPSVDDLEEFEEEKTVDQDLSSATYSYASHGCSFLSTTVVPQSNVVSEDDEDKRTDVHQPLSLRGSGSGYCGSDPLTDSDFYTESEADHDQKSNRNARIIDGNLYTSHIQSTCEREEKKKLDTLNSDLESSGFYSDSDRIPSEASSGSATSVEMFQSRRDLCKGTQSGKPPYHRQQHYSSSSQQSEEAEIRDCPGSRTISQHDLILADSCKGDTTSLEKFISDELDHEKCAESDKTLTGVEGDSSSCSSSSQVLQTDSPELVERPVGEDATKEDISNPQGSENLAGPTVHVNDGGNEGGDIEKFEDKISTETLPSSSNEVEVSRELPSIRSLTSPVAPLRSSRNTNLNRKNIPAKEAPKTVGSKGTVSRLTSTNKAEQQGSKENRRKVVASKTDTGLTKTSSCSTKENSGLSSVNRSTGGSHHSLANVETDPKNISTIVMKKLNKWDRIMSQISESKNRPINIKEVKSKVYNSKISSNPVQREKSKTTADKIVPPLQQNHFSSKKSDSSSTSSLDVNFPNPKNRLKVRQTSDLSSASETQSGRRILKSTGNSKTNDKLSIPTCPAQEPKKRSNISNNSGGRSSELSNNGTSRNMKKTGVHSNSTGQPLKGINGGQDNFASAKRNLDNFKTVSVQTDDWSRDSEEIQKSESQAAEQTEILNRTNAVFAICLDYYYNNYLTAIENEKVARRKDKNLLEQKDNQLCALEEQIKSQNLEWESKYLKLLESNQKQMESIKESFDEEKSKLTENYERKLEEIRQEKELEIQKSLENHKIEMEDLIAESNRKYDEYKKKAPGDLLWEEIRSLRIVVDLKNTEIKRLKGDLICYSELKNDFILIQEVKKSLQSRIEDLNSQLEKLKSDKRQLTEKSIALESNFSQLENENSRLSLLNEEISWRLQILNTQERVSDIMTKSANCAELDLKSTSVNALFSGSRHNVESLLKGPQYQSTPNAGFASFNNKKKSHGYEDRRQLSICKSLDESDLRNTLNGFRREICDRLVSVSSLTTESESGVESGSSGKSVVSDINK